MSKNTTNYARPSDWRWLRDVRELQERMPKGTEFKQAANALESIMGKPLNSIYRAAQRARVEYRNAGGESYQLDEYTYTGVIKPGNKLPVFDGYFDVHVDGLAVIGDVHLPTTDMELAERMLEDCHKHNIRNLAIIGDLVNFDVLGRYPHLVPPHSLDAELSAAQEFLDHLTMAFDNVWLTMGNHEHRMLKEWPQLPFTRMAELFSTGGLVEVSPYGHMVATVQGVPWRLTHQRNYSRLPLRVARDLAVKYQMNTITHHEHHLAKGTDTYGRYVVINNGGLHDSSKMAYTRLVDSTSPAMVRGYTLLVDGQSTVKGPLLGW